MALQLWLTDRSRYETGTGHCARARYLGSHAGPHGYGWARKAQSIPLVTGTMLAQIQERCHVYVRKTGEIPPEGTHYHAYIQDAIKEYHQIVADRGLTNVVDATELELRTKEQTTLLEGLAWTWYYVGLPQLLAEWRIIYVEQEEVTVLGCTCGLGDRMGTGEEHDARDCQGLGYMTRGDLVCQSIENDARYSYHEFKAPSETNVNTDAAWAYRVQVVSGVMGAEDRLGVPIDEVFLHQHLKGKRQAEWDSEQRKAVGPKFQNSPLVYGWMSPANPPLKDEQWAASFNYQDELGKNRRLTKDYARTPIWEAQFEEGALSASHYWIQWLGYDKLAANYRKLVLPRKDYAVTDYTAQLIGEEARWQAILWELHDSGHTWGQDAFMALLNKLVPQNRGQACVSYYGEHCAFLPLCDKKPGWEMPDLGGFIPRRPHHAPELAQAIERGLLPPDEGLAEEGEE